MAIEFKDFKIKEHRDLLRRIDGLQAHRNNPKLLQSESHALLGNILERMLSHYSINDEKLRELLAIKEHLTFSEKISARFEELKSSDPNLGAKLRAFRSSILSVVDHVNSKYHYKHDHPLGEVRHIFTAGFLSISKELSKIIPEKKD